MSQANAGDSSDCMGCGRDPNRVRGESRAAEAYLQLNGYGVCSRGFYKAAPPPPFGQEARETKSKMATKPRDWEPWEDGEAEKKVNKGSERVCQSWSTSEPIEYYARQYQETGNSRERRLKKMTQGRPPLL